MRKITVYPGQTLADIALRYCGQLEAAFTIAHLNDVGITVPLEAGQQLTVPEPDDPRTVQLLERGGHQPAAQVIEEGQGIGYWTIEENFIVS
jgi:hypothetical protein